MPYSTLITELRGSTLLVTINRPDALNALNATALEELDDVSSVSANLELPAEMQVD